MPELRSGRVAHVVPGRVRIKLDRRELSGDAGDRLRSALLALPGIEDVRMTPQTGSLVVFHDPERIDVAGLIALGRASKLLALDALSDDPYAGRQMPMSGTASGIHKTFHGVDVRLAEITDGKWDLRSVVPFAFGALALRAFLRDAGALGAAPWYALAWYAFDSFWKLNQGRDGDRNLDPEIDPEFDDDAPDAPAFGR